MCVCVSLNRYIVTNTFNYILYIYIKLNEVYDDDDDEREEGESL